ncbi:MAG: hypothetical protein HYY03_02110 [Chloroflexi bacterium]|nr:hypothetical protein [Chloroflexota bacterium]
MENESGHGEGWGGPDEMRARAAEARGGLDYAGQPAGPAPRPPASRRRRLVRRATWLLACAVVLAGVFGGGWFSHGALQGGSPSSPEEKLAAALLPEDGVALDVRWGDIPRQLVQEGVIDLEKFKAAAQGSASPLTPDQLEVLSAGSADPLHIDADNAYFLLDVLWALGLANKNTMLTQGPMAQYGWDKAGGYASTGGWTIGAKPGPEYLATLDLIRLTPEQQAVVEEVALNSYRPCCGNMTAFPDCNHGMAALGLAELMASQGATADDIFAALKKISPFWFPTQYHHLALYFQRQDQEWSEVEPRALMSKEYSSSGGWQQVNAWLQQRGEFAGGAGGGKASGCAP